MLNLKCFLRSNHHFDFKLTFFLFDNKRVESIFGFYKGLAPNVLRVLPGTCTTFLVYENMASFFKKHARYE
jgi:hypothetical protein